MTVDMAERSGTLLCGEDAVSRDADGTVHLIGGVCADCGAAAFPRAPVCTRCMGENIRAERMPRRGTIYAFSTVHVAPKKWKLPMRIGYVDLANGVRVFTHLSDGEFAIGDAVEPAVAVVGEDADGAIESFVFTQVKP